MTRARGGESGLRRPESEMPENETARPSVPGAHGAKPTNASHGVPPFEVGLYDSFGVRLYYEIHGHGPRVLVFMHGILMDSKMNRRLAADLAALGHRVVLLDLPGHGLSEKPRRASYHRIDTYGRHVVALLDHLGIDQAVIGGVSLGGNVSLMVAAQNPQRVKGLIVEMPVLEWALPAAALTFTPLLLGVHFARPILERTSSFFRWFPRTGNGSVDSVLDGLSNRPRETAAVLHGILAGPIAPTVGQRVSMDIPALVIGHQVDRIHPFHDAEQLTRRLPRAELLQARSIFELRMHPERLTTAIDRFLVRVWGTGFAASQQAG
jgi:pimeloyl-ACP methyl ester carboxylesterase